MRKLEEKKIDPKGQILLKKHVVDAGQLYSEVYAGILKGAIVLSSEPFNSCTVLAVNRESSCRIRLTKVIRDLSGIKDNSMVSIFEDNHDIIIIPTSRERETLRELGVKLY